MRIAPSFVRSATVVATLATPLSVTESQAALYHAEIETPFSTTLDTDFLNPDNNTTIFATNNDLLDLETNLVTVSVDDLLPSNLTEFFSDTPMSRMMLKAVATKQNNTAERPEITSTYAISRSNSTGLSYLTIQDIGITIDAHPITFTRVSGPVGIAKETMPDGSSKTYPFAAVGIDTDSIVMKQIKPDPKGKYNIGDQVPMSNSDILKSENSRVAVAFTPDQDAIEELQIVLPHDAIAEEDITISLKDSNGNVTQTIDANNYQIIPANQSLFENVAEIDNVPDFLVLVIKNNAKDLSAIYDTMIGNGSYVVSAMSPMGRKVPTPFAFGEGMADHLAKVYAQLENPSFHFADASQNLQRRLSYNPNAESVDHDVQRCVFIGLQDMNPQALANVRVLPATVTDGTGIRPRDLRENKALVALDEFNNVVAAGSQAWWGVNYRTGIGRVSGSAPSGFLTKGSDVLSGCTEDKITNIPKVTVSKTYPDPIYNPDPDPRDKTPKTPWFTDRVVFTDPCRSNCGETPTSVPLPFGGLLLPFAVATLNRRIRNRVTSVVKSPARVLGLA